MRLATVRKILPLFALSVGLLVVANSVGISGGKDEEGFKQLFNGKNFDGWEKIVAGKADPADTFHVKDEMIYVTGKPNGYFYTDKSYENYVLRFDWKFLKDGNSGLLVHIQGEHKVWPKCVEVQGMQKDHGRIFDIGGLKGGKYTIDREAQKKAIKMGEWNTTEFSTKDGKMTAKINGIEVASGQATVTEGPFGFQSEGVPMLYKNIRIKVLD